MITPFVRTLLRRYRTVSMSTHCRQLDTNLPELKALLNTDVLRLCRNFIDQNHEIRVVGGAVRDMLMKREPKDIDLSTTATPEEMIEVFRNNEIRYIETGLQHGTLTAHLDHMDYEITTLRIDTETDVVETLAKKQKIDTESDGRKAVVKYTKDWYLDAERRDLTVNAMSVDVEGRLYDYFNGEEDLKQKKIRFVGNTNYRIREDYLRILRYFRFYGKIDADVGNHEKETLEQIKLLAGGLQKIAVERVWVEVKKILIGPNAPHLLKLMYELDVAENIGLPHCSERHFNEFTQVWKNIHNNDPQPVTLLVTLIDTCDQARELCSKWKLSNQEKDLAVFIVSNRHLSVPEETPLKPYQDFLVLPSTAKTIDLVRKNVHELLLYEGKLNEYEEIKNWVAPNFPITGKDLKDFGIKPGREFGQVLNDLKDKWIKSYYTLTRENLLHEISVLYNKYKNK